MPMVFDFNIFEKRYGIFAKERRILDIVAFKNLYLTILNIPSSCYYLIHHMKMNYLLNTLIP